MKRGVIRVQDQAGRDWNEADRTPRIIVIDDEESIRTGCEKVLGRAGYEVDIARDGNEGWDHLCQNDYDLALIDLKMPGIDGMSILRRMQDEMPDVVAIVITGYASYETAVETVKLGAYDYIPKPFTPEELRNVVERGLERRFLTLTNRRLRQERERHLLDLAQERSRLATIVRSMSDGVLVINRRRELVLYNPVAEKWVLSRGMESDAEAHPLEEVLKVDALEDLVRQIEDDPELDGCDGEIHLEDEQYVHAAAAAIRDEADTLLGVVIVLRDITERKEIERMKSAFVRMVSHELKSPLAAVEGYLNFLCDGSVGEEDADRMLKRCRTRIQSLQKMISDLLDISRLESGQVQRELRTIDLNEVLSEVVSLQEGAAMERNIEIDLQSDHELEIVADQREMDEIFSNLISNAIKYNRDEGKVTVTAKRSGGRIRVAVSDTGIGMAPESIDQIFDEFYRVRNRETANVSGTGLGLSIVKRIVDSYDGEISVDSQEGEGTTFEVELPVRGL